MKPKSRRQAWTRERNLNKGYITGMRTLSRQLQKRRSTTPYEQGILADIEEEFNLILESWNGHNELSRKLFVERSINDQHNRES